MLTPRYKFSTHCKLVFLWLKLRAFCTRNFNELYLLEETSKIVIIQRAARKKHSQSRPTLLGKATRLARWQETPNKKSRPQLFSAAEFVLTASSRAAAFSAN
jgi:hypothetical protein